MMSLSKSKAAILSLVAAMALTIVPTPASAIIYTRAGTGLCQPASGVQYSHIATTVSSTHNCPEACRRANHVAEEEHHLRGFSEVDKHGVNHAALASQVGGNCVCFYDCHRLPVLELQETTDEWIRHDPEACGEGGVETSDGTEGISCYTLLADASTVRVGHDGH